jgi:hypothetical protein
MSAFDPKLTEVALSPRWSAEWRRALTQRVRAAARRWTNGSAARCSIPRHCVEGGKAPLEAGRKDGAPRAAKNKSGGARPHHRLFENFIGTVPMRDVLAFPLSANAGRGNGFNAPSCSLPLRASRSRRSFPPAAPRNCAGALRFAARSSNWSRPTRCRRSRRPWR